MPTHNQREAPRSNNHYSGRDPRHDDIQHQPSDRALPGVLRSHRCRFHSHGVSTNARELAPVRQHVMCRHERSCLERRSVPMPPQKPRQRELAKIAYDARDFVSLHRIVGEAQNYPPLGQSDGSISEPEWIALRDLVVAESRLRDHIQTFAQVWRLA